MTPNQFLALQAAQQELRDLDQPGHALPVQPPRESEDLITPKRTVETGHKMITPEKVEKPQVPRTPTTIAASPQEVARSLGKTFYDAQPWGRLPSSEISISPPHASHDDDSPSHCYDVATEDPYTMADP